MDLVYLVRGKWKGKVRLEKLRKLSAGKFCVCLFSFSAFFVIFFPYFSFLLGFFLFVLVLFCFN